jgi:predicted ATP-dependent protease
VVGFTGEQGVLIPASNVRHLILRSDLVQAVADGKFHIYAVKTIDEGIAILTGVLSHGKPGAQTLNDAVAKRLKELAVGLKEFAASEKNGTADVKS